MPTVVANGLSLYYEEFGRGEPIVFLSGLGGDSRAFSVTIRYFSDRYRALAIDARDTGRSDRVTAPYSTADVADDLAAFLKTLGIPSAHVVGHSLGGLVAQEFAVRFPAMVRSLVLASTHSGASEWRKALIKSWIFLRRRCEPAEFTEATFPWLVAPPFYRNPSQIEGMIRFAERNPWPQDAETFARQAESAFRFAAGSQLGSIRVPTLVLAGALDLVNPPSVAQELAAQIPGARLVVFPEAGHLPHIEDGDGLRREIDRFLQSIRTS